MNKIVEVINEYLAQHGISQKVNDCRKSISNVIVNFFAGYDVDQTVLDLRNSQTELISRLESANQQKNNLSNRLDESRRSMNQTLVYLNESRQRERQLNSRIATLENQNQEKQQELAQLSRRLETEKRRTQIYLTRSTNFHNQLSENRHIIDELQQEIAQCNAKLSSVNNNAIQEKAEKEKLKAQLDLLNQENAQQKVELSEAKGKAEQEKAEREKLEEQLALLAQEKKGLIEEDEKLKEQIASESAQQQGSPEELRRLENELQRLEETLQRTQQECDGLKNELANKERRLSQITTAYGDLNRERNEIASSRDQFKNELEDAQRQVQSLSSEVERLNEENKELQERKSPQNTIGSEEVKEDKAQLLTEVENDNTSEPAQPINDDNTENVSKSAPKTIIPAGKRKTKIEDVIDLSGGIVEENQDFPEISNDSKHGVMRSIKYVIDDDGVQIGANSFFEKESASTIATMSRELASAYMDKRILWTCGLCHEPVKIAHRLNSLFFIHADRKGGYCPWRKPAIKSQDGLEPFIVDEFYPEPELPGVKPKYQELKEKIFAALTTQESRNMGIDNVRMDEIMRGHTGYMRWRRPDVSFTYQGRTIVLELQKKSHDTDFLVDKDRFYRLNHVQVIWIFGSDSDTSYDYMRGFSYKETLFDNHLNVFVFDKDAQQATNESGTLKLKCNWLDADGLWKYRIENTDSNGILIGLDNLHFDEESCKPYYYDANRAYFDKHVDERNDYETKLLTDDELAATTEEQWVQSGIYQQAIQQMKDSGLYARVFQYQGLWGFRYNNVVLIYPVFTEKPTLLDGFYKVCKDGKYGLVNRYGQKVVDWNLMIECGGMRYDEANQRIMFERNEKWGVADLNANILINPVYEDINPWNANAYRVMQGKWGICDINNQMIAPCVYDSIDVLRENKAMVEKTHPRDVLRSLHGYIDVSGKPVAELTVPQRDDNIAVKKIGLWGLETASGDVILPYDYDGVRYWTRYLYRVKLNDKWGVLDIQKHVFKLEAVFNRIGDLVDDVAPVVRSGVESAIDVNGKEVAQKTVVLQNGWKKTKFAGKWGIDDENGNEIVPHLYDEIGSFRSRVIGIITKRIIKLDADYNYPIQIAGRYKRTEMEKNKLKCYVIDIGGVKCRLHPVQTMNKNRTGLFDQNNMCGCLAFSNIKFENALYDLRVVTEANLKKILSKGDKDSDYSQGKVYTGVVKNYRRKAGYVQRLMVEFADGKTTRVTRSQFVDSGKDIADYGTGTEISLEKVGFDDDNDKTLWKVL